MTDTAVVEQITETDLMKRTLNHGLMVAWINHDLFNRAHHDVRTSLVLYDEDKMFVAALPSALGSDPNIGGLRDSLLASGVRYYSTGIV